MTRYKEIDPHKIKTVSVHDRKRRVSVDQLIEPVSPGTSFKDFWDHLPPFLASKNLKNLVQAAVKAVQRDKPVLIMMGAHVIKVGLSPIIIDLLKKKIIRGIAMNGAGAIHDMELAYFGSTSEDVGANILDGTFGMAKETAELLNSSIQTSVNDKLGFGEAVGKRIAEDTPPHAEASILGQAYQTGVPVTVHVGIGTDIVHQHANADGGAIGALSMRDFRIWANLLAGIGDGGVVLLFGSAVILPEVFIKAITMARNIYGSIEHFTTASFDMNRHYRPHVNVVERPNQKGGKGYTFVGHHELMIPLFAAALCEAIK